MLDSDFWLDLSELMSVSYIVVDSDLLRICRWEKFDVVYMIVPTADLSLTYAKRCWQFVILDWLNLVLFCDTVRLYGQYESV